MCPQRFVVLACLAAAVGSAQAQGAVSVSFVTPDQFSDAGAYGARRAANLRTIQSCLEQLGRDHLTQAQSLKVEVTDVDLAGTVRPSQTVGEIRIVRGGADRPRISLRYSLEERGAVISSGEESLSDIGYLRHFGDLSPSDPLRYEKRMLNSWFKSWRGVVAPSKG